MLVGLASKSQRLSFPRPTAVTDREKGVLCTEKILLSDFSLGQDQRLRPEEAVLAHGMGEPALATLFGMSPRMRIDLLVNDLTYRAVRGPLP